MPATLAGDVACERVFCAFANEVAVAGVEKVMLIPVEYVQVIVCSGYPKNESEPVEAFGFAGAPPTSALTIDVGILAHIAVVSAACAEVIGKTSSDVTDIKKARDINTGLCFTLINNTSLAWDGSPNGE